MTNKKTDIWNKIHIDSPDKCWKWKGKPHHTGYAFFYYENKEYMAHRITYELTYGPIPE